MKKVKDRLLVMRKRIGENIDGNFVYRIENGVWVRCGEWLKVKKLLGLWEMKCVCMMLRGDKEL
ncbi:hypothetical protein [Bacillus subtilis]|uniref:hypothetical protein n=1 Tax=Bacillus subtilis TaxID=1423 RepID=UPI0011A442B4|nr:hypothetical protein [Bacillus subtilis]